MDKARVRGLIEVMAAFFLSVGVIFGINHYARKAQPLPAEVLVLTIQGTISPGLDAYVERGLKEAVATGARAVLVEIGTLGGRIDAMDRIVELLRTSPVTVYTFVRGSAASAGALIALSGKKIAMAPGSAMGSAAPLIVGGEMDEIMREKQTSLIRAKFRAAAEELRRDGRPELRPEIAEGMVDPEMEIPGIKNKGRLISLSAEQALELRYCDVVAANRDEALQAFGLIGLRVRDFKQMPAEGLVRFLTDPTVGSFLLVLGFLGLLVEALTPGFGVAGIVGLLGLGLFFGARILSGLAGLEVIFLFLLGLILLALEVFVTPGFGILGILGLASVAGSVFLSYSSPTQAVAGLSGAVFVTLLMGFVLLRYLDRHEALRPILLTTALTGEKGYTATPDQSHLLGLVGKAMTPLRPAGVALLAGERVDVISEGGFIPVGTAIRVIKVEGSRIVVRPSAEE
ncbi:MAG: nodulation protein NfeD [Firmicutes bacterium]|nr:nodulation protein NfeD [Bacillota bacterium]